MLGDDSSAICGSDSPSSEPIRNGDVALPLALHHGWRMGPRRRQMGAVGRAGNLPQPLGGAAGRADRAAERGAGSPRLALVAQRAGHGRELRTGLTADRGQRPAGSRAQASGRAPDDRRGNGRPQLRRVEHSRRYTIMGRPEASRSRDGVRSVAGKAVTEYFCGLVEEALDHQGVDVEDLTAYYVVQMLAAFARTDNERGRGVWADAPLALRLGRALEAGGSPSADAAAPGGRRGALPRRVLSRSPAPVAGRRRATTRRWAATPMDR